MRRGRTRPLGVVVLVVVGVAACGGGESGDDLARADQTTSTVATVTTTDASTTTTSTTEAVGFEPLLADPALDPIAQVEAAYLYSWEVYSEAVLRRDQVVLGVIYRGEALETAELFIEDLLRSGRAVVVSVDHDFEISMLDSETAVVRDQYFDRSNFIDPQTQAQLTAFEGEQFVELSTFRLQEGQWVFVSVVRL